MKNKILLVMILIWPIIASCIILHLYNIWFDTSDMIKYNPAYSPEFDQDKGLENFIFWTVLCSSFVLELFFVHLFRRKKYS